ncbi:MAG: hypothetical protein J1E41_05420 [Ruminococcus sp.]|nr:hypothetical protein [Ruminococcus sp.]
MFNYFGRRAVINAVAKISKDYEMLYKNKTPEQSVFLAFLGTPVTINSKTIENDTSECYCCSIGQNLDDVKECLNYDKCPCVGTTVLEGKVDPDIFTDLINKRLILRVTDTNYNNTLFERTLESFPSYDKMAKFILSLNKDKLKRYFVLSEKEIKELKNKVRMA